LRAKKIKGLHENDFITAAKIDRLAPKGWARCAVDRDDLTGATAA
jgi:hypothetical protein